MKRYGMDEKKMEGRKEEEEEEEEERIRLER